MKRLSSLLTISVFLLSLNLLQAQTMGLFYNNEAESLDGYTLLAPTSSNNTYLIDNCGRKVHEWLSDNRPGLSNYLLENGVLLRTEKISGNFFGGGVGGKIKMIDWDGTILWDYTFADDLRHQHHDVEYLPNGNILLLAWQSFTEEEILAKGRLPGTVDEVIWLTNIVEVQPEGLNDGIIVWEWRIFDHLAQDIDETKENFVTISENPQLLNINYNLSSDDLHGNEDWLHVNSIDYNPQLDQIILSSRPYSEIWIIDHSTTTEEAAGHTGGNAGRGGDLLYRWGNPLTYDRGDAEDVTLYGQHDAQWIESGLEEEGKLMVFNNGVNRPEALYSSIEIWTPPMDLDGNYIIEETLPIGPVVTDWSFAGEGETAFFSVNVSGVQRLSNGNTLICEGREGRIFEINENEELVWDYVNPILQTGPATQGQELTGNTLFRAYKYPSDYGAFEGKNLMPTAPLELEALESDCGIPSSLSILNLNKKAIKIAPNPASNFIKLESAEPLGSISISNVLGKKMLGWNLTTTQKTIDISSLKPGIYFINSPNTSSIKLVKW